MLLYTSAIFAAGQLTAAQYIQDYTWRTVTNPGTGALVSRPYWAPDPFTVEEQGVSTDPEVVVLDYNCDYLREICINLESFINSGRGQARAAQNRDSVFAFDMDQTRKNERRREACGGYPTGQICPHAGQQPPIRDDGPWFTADTDTLGGKILRHRRTNNVITDPSFLKWTCEEMPAASWIEGGTDNTPAFTPNLLSGDASNRCAPFACGGGHRSEQNWQGFSHRNLRYALLNLVNRRAAEFPNWNPTDGFAVFKLSYGPRGMNGVPAKVSTYATQQIAQAGGPTIANQDTNVKFKRSANGIDYHDFAAWLNKITIEELDADYTLLSTSHTFVNSTSFDEDSLVEDEQLKLSYDNSEAYDSFSNPRWHGTNLSAQEASSVDDFESSRADIDVSGTRDPANIYLQEVDAEHVAAKSLFPALQHLYKRGDQSDLDRAVAVVEAAIAESAKRNKARYMAPLRNKYKLAPGTVVGGKIKQKREESGTSAGPPLLVITDKLAAAAALVTEAHAKLNVTKEAPVKRATGTYWMQSIARKGTVPWGGDSTYKVFRNVLDYGAKGDGSTDDTAAIKRAMTDGKRCGEKCNGSTIKNAIVYFPPGNYLISSTIPMPFGTQVIGDASNRPKLVASAAFIGLGVLSSDEYTGGGTGTDGLDQEYYVNTANFYRQVRNLIIDVTQTVDSQQVSCLHWQVGQATSLQNLQLVAKTGSAQRGIFAENGSGGVMSDLSFIGGAYGLYGGNQQFTSQRLSFSNCNVGVQVIWDWGWIWKSIRMTNVKTGFRLLQEQGSTNGNIGSAAFLDSTFLSVGNPVLINPPNAKTGSGSTGIVIENCRFLMSSNVVADTTGKVLLSSSGKVDSWVLGPAYLPGRQFVTGLNSGSYRRQPGLTDSDGSYFERPKPQYENNSISDFVHVKDFGAKGDGSTDDTAALQKALYSSQGKILFIDAGSYILTSTVVVPSGSKLVGETWSQLVASGSYFADTTKPQVMLQIGRSGDVGAIEMQDLLFTSRGNLPGLIMVEWNIMASSQGAAALWDCHARVGGAIGTQLTPKECPPVTQGTVSGCNAASLMMHITPTASGYFENMWLWVADHMIDDPDMNDANNTMVQTTVYVARGLLVQSQAPVWLYGTASEHAVFYQYNFNNAKNVFAAILQTESAYYQPNPRPPFPYAASLGKIAGDPTYNCSTASDFNGCDESWAIIIRGSSNIQIGGAGLYSWFSTYSQTCVDSQTCQKALILLQNNADGIRFRNLITIGAKWMAVEDGKGISAADNMNVNSHPFWSQVTAIDFKGNGTQVDGIIYIDPKIWDMDQPRFTCSPPCVVQLPPYPYATSTVNFPLVRVSSGTWTSVVTKAPIAVDKVFFAPVTLSVGSAAKEKRQAFSEFWPEPIATLRYPAVTYLGPDGLASTTRPTGAIARAASIGPNAPAPQMGKWPLKAVYPVAGAYNSPVSGPCAYDGSGCVLGPEQFIPGSQGGLGGLGGIIFDPDDDSELSWDDRSPCPILQPLTSTSPSKPTEIVRDTPRISENQKNCYGKGKSTIHERLDNAIGNFCRDVASPGQVLNIPNKWDQSYDFTGSLRIDMSMAIRDNCSWTFNQDDCKKYFLVPVDSCNCGGINGKQGGTVWNNCLSFKIDPNNGW